MGIFRTATGQAIREIISENATEGTFGISLAHESLDDVCNKIVDLFEMTLELRGKTSALFGGADFSTSQVSPPQISSSQVSKTESSKLLANATQKHSYTPNAKMSTLPRQPERPKKSAETSLVSGVVSKVAQSLIPYSTQLPRKRSFMTEEEKERFKK